MDKGLGRRGIRVWLILCLEVERRLSDMKSIKVKKTLGITPLARMGISLTPGLNRKTGKGK